MTEDNSKHEFGRRKFLRTTGAVGLAATAGVGATSGSAAAVEVEEPAQWTEEMVAEIERTEENTAPYLDEEPTQIAEEAGYWVWDTWPLRNRDGSVAIIDGWQIIFSLVADKSRPEIDVPGDRHNYARVGYFYSRAGKSEGPNGWQFGGEVFDEDAFLGNQTWAGSAMYDQDEEQIYHFYTAADALPEARQRLALAKGATVETGPQDVTVSESESHHILAEADGEMYEQLEDSSGIITAFRDPWYFKHPETGEDWMIFEGNTPTENNNSDSPLNYNGNIGAAKATSEDLTEWELKPPIFEAVGVSQQTERPHFIFQEDKWYLFFITHEFTYAPQLWSEGGRFEKKGKPPGPEALHGFAADGLYDSDMEPLNGSSLVVANPEKAPFQTYSWLAMPHGSGSIVESFVNFQDVDTLGLPGDELKEAFGGTLAPSLKVDIDGTDTSITTELKDGQFPASVGARSRGNGRNS
ncbi:levansucrase [Halogranum amylolyticum]|uniref:Levansucrase n=1 Tax=Halogranum amylolyticum TaxID=660520 RepID=A0A1H8VTG6_9EURY|nr:glycoside hydrolase family 68 protein [Halogranum amylolyticum]SEP18696.1 levansucrase [Halogranum amylolyticum]